MLSNYKKVPQKKCLLVCEDAVRTGKSLNNIIKFARNNRNDIIIVSLAMHRDSNIVPNFFALEVHKDEEIVFPWDNLPIRYFPKGIIRKLTINDLTEENSRNFRCGDSRLDRFELADYYMRSMFDNRIKTYVLEDRCELVSMINLYVFDDEIMLDVLITREDMQRKGYARIMLDIIFSYMLYHRKTRIKLFSLDTTYKLYEKLGFEATGSPKNVPGYGKLREMVFKNKRNNL